MTYNPMSKEFQDECKRLGLTGRQLTEKYRKEGKFIKKEPYMGKVNDKRGSKRSTEDLLSELRHFEKENGRPPTVRDFTNNSEYPSYSTYQRIFGSWSNALKLVELDVESMIKKGILLTNQQKERFGEIIIRDHFKNNPVDLAGENRSSPCDGICPNGKTYDVKSSGLSIEGHYRFHTNNKYKEEIEIYYLLGFNRDYTKLDYGWRIPGEIAENDDFYIGIYGEFNMKNMNQYDITDKLTEVLSKYGFF